MFKFTIDFLGLVNAQKIPLDHLAKKTGLVRDTVHTIAKEDPPRYHRGKVGQMLKALGVTPYPPLLLEETEDGLRLTVDWPGLLELNDAKIPWLVKHTKLRAHRLYHMINRDPTEYDRTVLGTTLNVLNVSLYPPFFLVNTITSEPRGPYDPQTTYYRSNRPT